MVPEGCWTAPALAAALISSPGLGGTTAVPVGPNIWQKTEASLILAGDEKMQCGQRPANGAAVCSLSKKKEKKKRKKEKKVGNNFRKPGLRDGGKSGVHWRRPGYPITPV